MDRPLIKAYRLENDGELSRVFPNIHTLPEMVEQFEECRPVLPNWLFYDGHDGEYYLIVPDFLAHTNGLFATATPAAVIEHLQKSGKQQEVMLVTSLNGMLAHLEKDWNPEQESYGDACPHGVPPTENCLLCGER